MRATSQNVLDLTADDLMTRQVVRLTEEMPLRDAARLVIQNQIGGAPVVKQRPIGMVSSTNVLGPWRMRHRG
jgi:CBS domain-containing protein